MTLFVLVTADEYELPLAVRDTLSEIAELTGRSRYDIPNTINRKQVSMRPYNGFKYRIIRIDMEEEGEEDGDSREDPDHSQALHS